MQTFTPLEYLKIDIANCYGLEKETWQFRLAWIDRNLNLLEQWDDTAQNPILFRKAVRALRDAEQGLPTGHIMGLDATASGPQIMACMSGCLSSMKTVNVVDTGSRRDIYTEVSQTMTDIAGIAFSRADVKQPTMTFFYGSKAVPKQVFSEHANHFFNAMTELMPGPAYLMQLFQAAWDTEASHYQWIMPDGHNVCIPVTAIETKGMEIDEADHFRYTYRTTVVKPQEKGRSLAANIVHSVDAWICRQLIRRANKLGFQVVPIHDCFYASPKHIHQVRELYVKLLLEVYEGNFVNFILSQICGRPTSYKQLDTNLSSAIRTAEYALS